MCDTCHVKTDPDFPSSLKLGAKCKDCHGALENVPAEWRIDGNPPVRIGAIQVNGGPEEAISKIRKNLEAMLVARGFKPVPDASVACPVIEAAIEVFRVRENRFVKAGEHVMQARVVVELKDAGSGATLLRKRAVSRPEYHADPREAATNAARDALALLSAPIAEALRTAYVSSGWGMK